MQDEDHDAAGDGPPIVQPPADFADSPNGHRHGHGGGAGEGSCGGRASRGGHGRGLPGRLYKKAEQRFRSEERALDRRAHRMHGEGARARSEERIQGERERRSRFRQHARSTDASMDDLEQRASGSSTSVAMRSPDGPDGPDGSASDPDDEDGHVYADSFRAHHWIFIGDSEEARVWQPPDERDRGGECDHLLAVRKQRERTCKSTRAFSSAAEGARSRADASDGADGTRRGSIDSTSSERDFRNRFTYITHRMVHRKVAGEFYRRRLASESIECDKTVNVRRGSGEFGLRVHGARPVVVASVEPESPALSSGLEVGDMLISVNGVNVLESPHSEVIRIAHAGTSLCHVDAGAAATCGFALQQVATPRCWSRSCGVSSLSWAGTSASFLCVHCTPSLD